MGKITCLDCSDFSQQPVKEVSFATNEEYIEHLKSAHGNQGFMCGGCHDGKWYETQEEVWAHMRKAHPAQFVQAHCKKSSMYDPVKKKNKQVWVCPHCNAHDMDTKTAFDHIITNHLDKVDVIIDKFDAKYFGGMAKGWITKYPSCSQQVRGYTMDEVMDHIMNDTPLPED